MLQETNLQYKKVLQSFLAEEFFSKLPEEIQILFSRATWDVTLPDIAFSLFIDCKSSGLAKEIYGHKTAIASTVQNLLEARNLSGLGFEGKVFFCAKAIHIDKDGTADPCPTDCDGSAGCFALSFADSLDSTGQDPHRFGYLE